MDVQDTHHPDSLAFWKGGFNLGHTADLIRLGSLFGHSHYPLPQDTFATRFGVGLAFGVLRRSPNVNPKLPGSVATAASAALLANYAAALARWFLVI